MSGVSTSNGSVMTLNATQKVGLCVAGIVLIALFLIHNPTEGYKTRDLLTITKITNGPPLEYFQKDSVVTPDQLSRLLASEKVTATSKIDVPLKFLDWKSNGALVKQATTIGNVLIAASGIVLASLAFSGSRHSVPNPVELTRSAASALSKPGTSTRPRADIANCACRPDARAISRRWARVRAHLPASSAPDRASLPPNL